MRGVWVLDVLVRKREREREGLQCGYEGDADSVEDEQWAKNPVVGRRDAETFRGVAPAGLHHLRHFMELFASVLCEGFRLGFILLVYAAKGFGMCCTVLRLTYLFK